MPEEQNKPQEQNRPEEQNKPTVTPGTNPTGLLHIARTPQGQQKEEPTKTYRVKDGQVWGTNPELKAGDTVELTEAEAASFEDKLEPADGPREGQQPPQQPPQPPPSVPKRTS